MGYLDEIGLARYDGLIKNWVTYKSGTVEGIEPLLNWQKTGTAGAVTCYPLPASPLEPVVNFLFTESGPASGTKSPTNPSTITGVSSVAVTRCGKNVLPYPYRNGSGTYHSVTFTCNDDGSVLVNGTADANITFPLSATMLLKAGMTYRLSGCPSGGSNSTYYLGLSGGVYDVGSGASTTRAADTIVSLWISVTAGTQLTNLVFRPQLELGSTATSFEPYAGTDYTLPLGSTYYGGSVDLSAGTMTVTWGKLVLKGTEKWTSPTSVGTYNRFTFLSNMFPINEDSANNVCTHIPFLSSYSGDSLHYYISQQTSRVYLFTTDTSTTALNTWLSAQYENGTPVTMYCSLATPFTIPLTPTQIYSLSQTDSYTPRCNTIYSDQVSVQVGYPKSPQATSAELTNAIISLGGNV